MMSQAGPTSVGVLGIGQMGLVCAALAAAPRPDQGRSHVVLWGFSPEEAESIARTRRSPRLKGFVLPTEVEVTTDLEAVAGAGLLVAATPVQFMAGVWEKVVATRAWHAREASPDRGVVSVAKGIEEGTLRRPTEILRGLTGSDEPVAALSGPTIAPELARGLPAAMIAASDNQGLAMKVQATFGTSYVRIYTHDDLIGVELAGAVKNVIAIAAGVLDGLQAGYNAKSALLARGLAEIVRLGDAMGCKASTFFGIAGVGDLATTCFSPEGRNRSCGEALGRGQSLQAYLAGTRSVVEGVATTKAVMELARRHNVEMPIIATVHAVLFEGLDPIAGIERLMSRERKSERVG